jgi:cobaltochelatase CobN
MYMADQGTWAADKATLTALANEYIKQVIQYSVSCCHHTCKDLSLYSKLIQLSTLSNAEKQKFAEIVARATDTDPIYQMQQQQSSTDPANKGNNAPNSNTVSDLETGDDNNNAHELVNGTSSSEMSSSDSGATSAGQDASATGNAKTASDAQSASSASSSAGSSGAKSYELSEKSVSKAASASESSMPIFVIIAIIVLISIFLVGYLRSQDEDYDDY